MNAHVRRIVLIALCAVAIASCERHDERTYQGVVLEHFAGQPHRCIPLGWSVAAVDGSYVPSYSFAFSPRSYWMTPLWAGFVPLKALGEPQGALEYEILSRLVTSGMAERQRARNGMMYRLTERAFPYYFEENDLGDNPLHLSYLCYSRIETDRVVRSDRVARGTAAAFRVTFTWHEGSVAPWADDSLLQTHSVILAPVRSPAVVTIANERGSWAVTKSGYDATNVLTSPSAWPDHQ